MDGDWIFVLPSKSSLPGSGSETGLHPEGRDIAVYGKERRITLHVKQELPEGTKSLGLWLTGRGESKITFIVRDGSESRSIKSGCEEGMAPGPRQVSWVSNQGGLGAWQYCRAFLKAPSVKGMVLEDMEVVRDKPEATLGMGPLVASTEGASPFTAGKVWKIKNFQTPKPDSTYWTGSTFYEYGFASTPALRPAAWEAELATGQPESMRAVLRNMTGEPLWHASIGKKALARPLDLPDFPAGCYMLELTPFGADGSTDGPVRFVYQVLRNDHPGAFPVTDDGAYPWKLSGLKLGGPAADVNQPLAAILDLSGFLPKHPRLMVQWKVTDHAGTLHGEGSAGIASDKTAIRIPLKTSRPGGYMLNIVFTEDGRTVDAVSYAFGVHATSSTQPGDNAMPFSEEPLILSQLKVHHDADQMKRLPTDVVPELAEWAFDHQIEPAFLIFWWELEPVEGCFNWHIIDRYLDMAKNGQKIAIGINFSGDNLPEWLWFEELMSQGQQTIHHNYHYVTPFGPRFQAAHARLWKAILERYSEDPRIAAWIVQAGPSEGFVTDTPPKIGDYSIYARDAFRGFLEKKYGAISKLNATWKSDYKAFQEVPPPLPDFSLDWESSPEWWDFHLFKISFVPEYLERVQSSARAEDPSHPMIMYAKEGFGLPGLLGSVFKKNRFTYSNGGGESPGSFVQVSLMRRFGVPVMTENGNLDFPPPLGAVTSMTAYSLLAGGFTGEMLQAGMVWAKKKAFDMENRTAVGALCESLSRAAKELHTAEPAVNWAGYYSGTTEMLQSRSMRCRLYPSVNALIEASQVRLHNACTWVDDATPLDVLRGAPLIVDGGSKILAPESVQRLMDYMNAGGVFVFDSTTAVYQPGTARPTYSLLASLGAKVVLAAKPGKPGYCDAGGEPVVVKRKIDLDWTPETNATVLLRDSQDGKPLVWEKSLGLGRAIIIAGEIDWPGSASWLGSLVERYSGTFPYHVVADDCISGVLKGPQADYVVIRPLLVRNGRDDRSSTAAESAAAGKANARISGVPADAQVTEMIGNYPVTRTGDGIVLEVPRAMLAVVRISRPSAQGIQGITR